MTKSEYLLVHTYELKEALADFLRRNALIERLDAVSAEDAHQYEKQALAFWLGSNITLQDLARDGKVSDFLYIGYYVMLAFDKHISMLPLDAKAILQQAQFKILEYFNQHSALLTTAPKQLFTEFRSIILDMNRDALPAEQQESVREFQRLCIIELARVLNNYHSELRITKPSPEILNVEEDLDFNEMLMDIITAKAMGLFPFFKSKVNVESGKYPRGSKIFLPAADGTILEAIYYRQNKLPSKAVTFVLFGPFQMEYLYDADSMQRLSQMYGSDVVFINHRNYSLRSVRHAKSLDELADDVKTFADYFQRQNKDIRLYGLCGGGPTMVLAAEIMTAAKMPYKLILDRSFDSYNGLGSLENLLNFTKVQLAGMPEDKAAYYLLKLHWYTVKLTGFISRSVFSRIDRDVGAIVRTLPENDVITLQGKTATVPDASIPACADKFIGPEINIRNAVKERRHQRKALLRELCSLSQTLAQDDQYDAAMRKAFSELEQCFLNCLKLISDEKLHLIDKPSRVVEFRPERFFVNMVAFALANEKRLELMDKPGRVRDIHSEWPYRLTTRDNTPLSRFLHGFCSIMPEDWSKRFEELNPEKAGNETLQKFLQLILENKNYLAHMTYRVKATGFGDIASALDVLTPACKYRLG